MAKANVYEFANDLQLVVLHPGKTDTMIVESREIFRPGLQLAGFYDFYTDAAVQVIGRTEVAYLNSLEPEVRRERIYEYFSHDMACAVFCWGIDPPPEVMDAAREYGRHILVSRDYTTYFEQRCATLLNHMLAPFISMHGVLLSIEGVGVMLVGDSGIGKSETALELLKRGHALVADDAVDVRRISRTQLVGESPALISQLMEVRGVGMVDVLRLYGISGVMEQSNIDLVVYFERWIEGKAYDRIGDMNDAMEILGVEVPRITVPVAPGRNLAIIIEIAARNHRLKLMGHSALKEMEERMSRLR